jgi:hypothetical protein
VSGVPAILARLSALGARIERRGDKLILCAGGRPVPQPLVEQARAAKAELLRLFDVSDPANVLTGLPKALTGPPKALKQRTDEHLSAKAVVSAAETQGGRLRCSPSNSMSILTQREHLSGATETPATGASASNLGASSHTPATLFAPWFGQAPAEGEPPYDEPCPARRGVVRRPRGRFEHFCAVCGAWGAYGFEVTAKEPGRWYCFRHRASGILPQ